VVTDANGYTASSTISITEDIIELGVSLDLSSQLSCAGSNDGSVRAVVRGGKRPFTFKWSEGSSAEEIGNAGPGSYTVTVTDAVGQTSSATVELKEPSPISVEVVNIRAAAAEHVPDGKAAVKISGGAGNYSIEWDNGDNTVNTGNLAIGNHTVTVTDGNGCSQKASFEISKKILPELTAETLRSGSAIRIEQIQFDADSTRIRDESYPALRELYEFLYDNPTIVVEIGGHTNGLPPHEYCDSLSTARAKSVAEYIVSLGIEPKRVYYKGYGKRQPIATNQTPEGRRRNQRVEVKMLELREED